jgi:hypothetical protein
MRYGKKLAMMVDTCASKGIERPLISHRVLKELLSRAAKILKSESDTSEIPAIVREFRLTIQSDLFKIITFMEKEEAVLRKRISDLENQGKSLGFLESNVLDNLLDSIEKALVSPNVGLHKCIGDHMKGLWVGLTVSVAGIADIFNSISTSMQSLLSYADLNVAGFRKLIKQYCKQIPGTMREDVVSVEEYRKILGGLMGMVEKLDSIREHTERIMQRLSPGAPKLLPIKVGSETFLALSASTELSTTKIGSGASTAPNSPPCRDVPDFVHLLGGTNVDISSLEKKLLNL